MAGGISFPQIIGKIPPGRRPDLCKTQLVRGIDFNKRHITDKTVVYCKTFTFFTNSVLMSLKIWTEYLRQYDHLDVESCPHLNFTNNR